MIFVRASAVNVSVARDWRAGDVVRVIDFQSIPTLTTPLLQVLKRSCVEDSFLSYPYSEFTSLDQFRLLASTGLHTVDVHELYMIVFATSIPQRSRYGWRRFNIALMHHDRMMLGVFGPGGPGFTQTTIGHGGKVLVVNRSSLIQHNP